MQQALHIELACAAINANGPLLARCGALSAQCIKTVELLTQDGGLLPGAKYLAVYDRIALIHTRVSVLAAYLVGCFVVDDPEFVLSAEQEFVETAEVFINQIHRTLGDLDVKASNN